ncbi:MAG: hypothetical protein P4L36_11630 [Holophaga sp.]|nr:hypothetical protein [Holophaga sp.]
MPGAEAPAPEPPAEPAPAPLVESARPTKPRGHARPVRELHPAPVRPSSRPGPAPLEVVRTREGGEIRRGTGGALRELRTPGGTVVRYLYGGRRRVETPRPGGGLVHAEGTGLRGYVQTPLQVRGQALVRRSIVADGAVAARIYRPWAYRGDTFNLYLPSSYWRAGFYDWARRPWSRLVYYRWGWKAQPWFRRSRPYFRPSRCYTGPVFWLTDFMLGATLEEAYQADLDDGLAGTGTDDPGAALTPVVQQAMADEVRLLVEQEQAEQQALAQDQPLPPWPRPSLFSGRRPRVLLVAGSVPAWSGDQEWLLPEGTVLQLAGPPPAGASRADVVVLASRGPSFTRGTVVSVALGDLVELQNRMRATLDQGLAYLQAHPGGQLPGLPGGAQGRVDPPWADGLQPDPAAPAELSRAARDAAAAEQGLLAEAPPDAR